jgi:hypothetical protein
VLPQLLCNVNGSGRATLWWPTVQLLRLILRVYPSDKPPFFLSQFARCRRIPSALWRNGFLVPMESEEKPWFAKKQIS